MFLELFSKKLSLAALVCSFFWIALSSVMLAQTPSPNSILTRSIAFHDPQDQWETSSNEFILRESRPGSPDRSTILQIDLYHEIFNLDQNRDGNRIQYFISGDTVDILFNGSADYTAEQEKQFHLTEERALILKDYYSYLYGLPMKLRDPGTILDPKVEKVLFQDNETWRIRVTYEEEVGGDIWYFYFDPESFALVGYQFFHDEAARDGEYIVLEDLKIINGLSIPQSRSWHTNSDSTFLGKDVIE